jgi:hypothetical protein
MGGSSGSNTAIDVSAAQTMKNARYARSGAREIEWQVEAAAYLLHLFFGNLLCALLCFRDCCANQIFEHFNVVRINHRFIDLYLPDPSTTIGRDRYHPATAGAGNRLVRQLGLKLRQPGLYLLPHLKKLLEICHAASF